MKNINIYFIALLILFCIGLLANNTSGQDKSIKVTKIDSETENKTKKKSQINSDDDSWRGFYVGGFAGGTINRNDSVMSSDPITILSRVDNGVANGGYFLPENYSVVNKTGRQRGKNNGFIGGATFGYNYQKGLFVVGGEVDFGSRRIESSEISTAPYNIPATSSFVFKQSVKSDWLFTARPRVGISLKKALVYATGGVAVTNIEYDGNFSDNILSAKENGSFKKTKTGWTAGGGIEFKINNRWSAKGEYLFSQFGRSKITSNNFTSDFAPNLIVTFPLQVFEHSTNLNTHSIRFGINYRF